MTHSDTDNFLAEQTVLDTRPAQVGKLVHALAIGGQDFAADVLTDMSDVASDALSTL